MTKLYKLNPPIGNIVIKKEWMTEKEVREFLPTIIGDPSTAETWREKADKDPIVGLLGYLVQAQFSVTEKDQ